MPLKSKRTIEEVKSIVKQNKQDYDNKTDKAKNVIDLKELDYIELLKIKYKSKITLESKYYGYSFKFLAKHKCWICRNEWWVAPVSLIKGKYPCSICYKPDNYLGYDKYVEQLKNKNNNIECVDVPDNYKGVDTKILHRCKKCLHEWNCIPNNVLRKSSCPICSNGWRHTKNRVICVRKDSKGKIKKFNLLGFEPQALNILIREGYKVEDIECNGDKNRIYISYKDKQNMTRIHFPDFHIKTKNLLVEVKSTWTIAINEKMFQLNKLKYKCALKQGYNYKLMLISKTGKEIILPKNWINYSYTRMKTWIGDKK